MAWLGDGLPSLSSLKGQLQSFTKEVLSDGIVNEISDEREKNLAEARAQCTELQELLNSKEAEISILRKQNNELQKAVVEFRTKPNDAISNGSQDEEAFFWDPPTSKSREAKAQTKLLQDQLDQAAVRIRDLEAELNGIRTLNTSNMKDEANFKDEGPSQKAELLRAKQDVMNRIIQMGEKGREAERNARRLQQNELTLVNDFRTALSKLATAEQFELVKSALLALENESERFAEGAGAGTEVEKSDSGGYDAEGKSGRAMMGKPIGEADSGAAELRRRIEELEEDNRGLSASMDELDKQNAESIERILSLKEELQKKHHSLQSAYEHLYVDYNEALSKLDSLQEQQTELPKPSEKQSLDSAVQTLAQSTVDQGTEIHTVMEDKLIEAIVTKEDKETEIENREKEQPGLTAEVEKVKEILKTITFEPSEESLLVGLANEFVELKWKQEMLERQLTDQSLELKESQDQRDAMQIDCEDMQANIESLLMQIQHLKSNLPSIPEASEERVASLETETESLQDEIRSLRKTNSDMSSELEAIKAAIKEAGANVDLARIEELLEHKSKDETKSPTEVLQATLDENTALRRRIDVLESELRVSLERCKGLDENIELIEELKLDLENARRELKIALSNNKRLENSLTILQEAKNELDADNEVLVREKDQLETDLKLLRESDLKRNDGEALAELRDQMKKISDEKNDLEYDIRNMRNELDRTIEELEIKKTESDKLQIDNEQLNKEKNKLLDQYSDTHNESLDKIELLNTEMILLQQELDGCKEEYENVVKLLKEMEENKLLLENENESLNNEVARMKNNESENEKLKKKIEERLIILEDENKKLILEATKFKEIENEKEMLKREIEEVLLQNNLNNSKTELDTAYKRLKELEEKNLLFENENKRLQTELIKTEIMDSENRRLAQEIQEKQTELIRNSEQVEIIMSKLKCAENYNATMEDENNLLKNKLELLGNAQIENENWRKTVEEKHQQEIERRIKEVENNVEKELNVKYQSDLDKLKNLEGENQNLKTEIDRLLAEKLALEINSSELNSKESLTSESQVCPAEQSQLNNQLDEKLKEIETLKATIAKDKDSAMMARETVENLSQLISAKDNELIKMNASYDALNIERDKLIKLVQEKHNESLQYHAEIQRLTQVLNDQNVNLQKSVTEKDANLQLLKEKETELLWMQNELKVIKQRLQNVEETSNCNERCGITEHSLLAKQVSSLEEQTKGMEAAILQDQSNIRYLQEQLTGAHSNEAIALKEVERLRNHLVEVETSYNEEALKSEEIQKTLEMKLAQAEEKLKNSSTLYTSVSVRANQQVETLQQQLALIVQQRDELQKKISSAEDKVLSYSASLTNLQLVLEQFQRDKEKDIQAATAKLRQQLQDSYANQEILKSDISVLKAQLLEAQDCLEAASRLTEQLEKKTERIEELNQEVQQLTVIVNATDEKIQEALKIGDGKVDKFLVKNLLLGYISSPLNDKLSVLRVFANVLDFNESEREKSGLNSTSAKNSWFSSIVNSSSTTPSKDQETSLSSAFIKFLESESQPKPQLPALPISNSPINRPGHSRQNSTSSTGQQPTSLLLTNVTLPTFPDFVPARNTGSILKEVLKDS